MLDLARFQALTFDCYGTLIDWETGLLAAIRQAGLEAPDESLLSTFARFEQPHQDADPAPLYPEVLRRTILDVARALGQTAGTGAADRFGDSVGDWPAFADSAAALARLRRHFKVLGILSNIDHASLAGSRARLSTTAGDPFDWAVTAEDTRTYKPHHRHFEHGQARLQAGGIAPDRWLHVAQSLHHDHGPANALGIANVWIDRRAGRAGSGATPPTEAKYAARFESLADFADAVDRAFAAPA
jgi:2-haloacid dehalogenase